MTRQGQLLATVTAGAAGALVATLAVGSSLLLVIPAAIGIWAIALALDRPQQPRRSPSAPTRRVTPDDGHDRAA